MILSKLKEDNITALKSRNTVARSVLTIILNKVKGMEIELRTSGREIAESDIVAILVKTHKELLEEKQAFEGAGRQEQVQVLSQQIAIVEEYIPAMMTVEEILAEINTLADKSMSTIMRHFKTNFAGKCNMADVQKAVKML